MEGSGRLWLTTSRQISLQIQHSQAHETFYCYITAVEPTARINLSMVALQGNI